MAAEGEREIEEDDLDDGYYENDQIDLRADAGAVLPRAADEAAVRRRLQGAVPACAARI